jgi:hypothetical protein
MHKINLMGVIILTTYRDKHARRLSSPTMPQLVAVVNINATSRGVCCFQMLLLS